MNGWVVFGTVIGYTAISLALIVGIVTLVQKLQLISQHDRLLDKHAQDIYDTRFDLRKLTERVDLMNEKLKKKEESE